VYIGSSSLCENDCLYNFAYISLAIDLKHQFAEQRHDDVSMYVL